MSNFYIFTCFVKIFIVLYLTDGVIAVRYKSPLDPRSGPVATTDCGQVLGVQDKYGYSFRGIPYVLPPVGELRWKPPVSRSRHTHTCWDGILDGTTYGNTCFQYALGDTSKTIGSEDCLYLNVWTPTLNPNANLSVMVWIHGGFLTNANANWPTYSPTERLANETNMVYVGMNYRLNAFGFLTLDILTRASNTGTSGNYGFMDQIAALQWVQRNIANFGGNPNQVTLFGQSSGGTSIFVLLASPMAKDLFHKAWLLSASPVMNKTRTDASRDNEVFLRNSNCYNISCLYGLTKEQVINSIPWNGYPNWSMDDQSDLPQKGLFDGALAIVDGMVLKLPPFDSWVMGLGSDVPVIVGTTAQETDFSPYYQNMTKWNWTDYEGNVRKNMMTFGTDVAAMAMAMYPTNVVSPEYQFTTISTDIRVTCGNDILTMYAAMNMKSPVYRYVLTATPSQPVHVLGMPFPSPYSFHMLDMFAFFGSLGDYISPLSSSDVLLQENIRNEIISFVRTGKPMTADWQRYPLKTALLSTNTTAQLGYHAEQCNVWLMKDFFKYSWIN